VKTNGPYGTDVTDYVVLKNGSIILIDSDLSTFLYDSSSKTCIKLNFDLQTSNYSFGLYDFNDSTIICMSGNHFFKFNPNVPIWESLNINLDSLDIPFYIYMFMTNDSIYLLSHNEGLYKVRYDFTNFEKILDFKDALIGEIDKIVQSKNGMYFALTCIIHKQGEPRQNWINTQGFQSICK